MNWRAVSQYRWTFRFQFVRNPPLWQISLHSIFILAHIIIIFINNTLLSIYASQSLFTSVTIPSAFIIIIINLNHCYVTNIHNPPQTNPTSSAKKKKEKKFNLLLALTLLTVENYYYLLWNVIYNITFSINVDICWHSVHRTPYAFRVDKQKLIRFFFSVTFFLKLFLAFG